MIPTKFLVFPLLLINFFLYSLDIQKDIIQKGESLIGTPYKMGGVSPGGFDCSGFVNYLYKPFVPEIPRISGQIASYGTPLELNSVKPGDLIFFATGTSSRTITHVAVYIGQNSILHSISNGPERGVTITSLTAAYWKSRYFSAARVLPDTTEGTDKTTIRYAKGTYTGELQDGEPEGYGNMQLNNGDSYEGMFSKGTFHGRGTYTAADGQVRSGNFQNGRFIETDTQDKNYLLKEESPWNDYDGLIEGDFQLWLEREKNSFEEWKKHN